MSDVARINRAAVLGLGLIGGSMMQVMRQSGVEVVGFDVSPEAVDEASAAGFAVAPSDAAAVHGADLVVLAMPLPEVRTALASVSAHLHPGTLLTDVGTLKSPVADAVAALAPHALFVGGHPLAGVEDTGWSAADPNAVPRLPVGTRARRGRLAPHPRLVATPRRADLRPRGTPGADHCSRTGRRGRPGDRVAARAGRGTRPDRAGGRTAGPDARRRLPELAYEPLVRAALSEDLGLGGDLTSDAVVPEDLIATGALVARRAGTVAGLDIALFAFRLLDPQAVFEIAVRDGSAFAAGATVARVTARARALLGAERTALNLLSHLSGIATETARYVAAAGGRCAIAETRKTLPGLRALEKYAVRAGGGANHRLRLDDAILVKDNHIALAGGIGVALVRARERAGHLVKIEIEVDSPAQLGEVLARAELADVVLLDNFSLADVAEAVRSVAGRLTIEVSGGVTLENIADLAATGIDVISVGALTHSVVALDIGLDIG